MTAALRASQSIVGPSPSPRAARLDRLGPADRLGHRGSSTRFLPPRPSKCALRSDCSLWARRRSDHTIHLTMTQ